jgi:Protein of unknown function (DUF2924)
MQSDVSLQIAKLHSLSRQELLQWWQRSFGTPAATGLRREILIPFLAYRLQENESGGLQPATRRELARIARNLETAASGKPSVRKKIKLGTRLYRRWRGDMHEVLVVQDGFEYRGDGYASLSMIANKITGTRWSGPAFFGLNTTTAADD